MSTRKNIQDSEIPFKESIGTIQSLLIVLVSIGAIEVGFFYNTLLAYVLMTIAFYEMIQV